MIMLARMIGAMAPANLLAMPMMLILFAALSRGPIIVTYGLTAVCSIVRPAPMTKSPVRNNPKVLDSAAGMKISDPAAIIHRPTDIPFLNPVFFRIADIGRAITKYAI